MAKKRNLFLILGISLLVLLTIGVFLASRFIGKRSAQQKEAQLKKESPFGEFSRIGKIKWEIGEIRLKYLRAEIRDKAVYLTGSYIDENGVSQMVQIFVGTVQDDGRIRLLTAIREKDKQEIFRGDVNFEDIVAFFGKDREILVSFLINVPDYEKVVAEGSFCNYLPKICALGERTIPFQWAYNNFWKDKVPPPGGIALYAITIIL